MASNLDICNAALVELGADPIADFTATKIGRTAKTLYDMEKPRLMRLHPWNFLKLRGVLGSPLAAPLFDWLYQFELPGDLIRLIQVGKRDYPIDYELVHRANGAGGLMTNVTPVPIVYLDGSMAEANWPSWYVDLMTKAMLARLAYAVTNSRTMAEDAKKAFEDELARCRAMQGSEVLSEDLGQPSEYLAVRY